MTAAGSALAIAGLERVIFGIGTLAAAASVAAIVLAGFAFHNRRLRLALRLKNGRLQELASIIDCCEDAIISHDLEGNILSWNPGAVRLYGYTAEEAVGMKIWPLIPPEHHPAVEAALGQVRLGRGVPQLEAVHLRKDLRPVDVFVTVSPVRDAAGEQVVAASVVARDITDHRRVKIAHTRERNLLRSLIDNLPDHIYVKDTAGRYVVDNAAHAAFVGCKGPDDVVGKTVYDLFPRDLAERYAADDERVMQTGEALVAREEPITTSAGHTKWLATTKVPFRDAAGATIGLVCISRDVTSRRRAELDREELERFLSSIVENIPDMIFVKDAAHLRFVKFNRAGEELLGIPREKMIGKNDYDFFPKEEADFFTTKDRAVLESRTLMEIPAEEVQTARGVRVLHTKKIPLTDEMGEPRYLLGISEDVTERRRAEREAVERNRLLEEAVRSERQAHDALKLAQSQMVQTEKLAALGQLVAGVAHEINNPLAFVNNNVAVLQRDISELRSVLELYRSADAVLEQADPATLEQVREQAERMDLEYVLENVPELLTRSREGLRRIQEIVKDLRDFARQDAVGDMPDGVDVNSGIESTLNIARGRARKNKVELIADLAPLPGITCNPAKINQVVLNLVVNAIDACEDGGKVTVRTRPLGGGVRMDVIDTGRGVPPEIRGRIFDPFFTTKPQGQGTGLGLSISHGIVSDHSGTIEVESKPGEGSVFTVWLPPAPKRPPDPEAIAAGKEEGA